MQPFFDCEIWPAQLISELVFCYSEYPHTVPTTPLLPLGVRIREPRHLQVVAVVHQKFVVACTFWPRDFRVDSGSCFRYFTAVRKISFF